MKDLQLLLFQTDQKDVYCYNSVRQLRLLLLLLGEPYVVGCGSDVDDYLNNLTVEHGLVVVVPQYDDFEPYSMVKIIVGGCIRDLGV